MKRTSRDRRLAILVAFSRSMEASAIDEGLEILEQLLGEIFGQAAKADQRARLRHLRDLDRAATTLAQVCAQVLDEAVLAASLREAIFARVPWEDLAQAHQSTQALVRSPDDVFYSELQAHTDV